MILDSRLNWEEHINKFRAKAKRALNTIKVEPGNKWGGDRQTLKKLYDKNRLWLLIIQYSFCRKTENLYIIHSEGIRIYTGAFRTSPVECLLVDANESLSGNKKERTGTKISL